jgi:hypothetical protein
MAKKSPFGSWPPKTRKPSNPFAPPKQPSVPAPRNSAWEGALCTAIRNSVLVELRYEDDIHGRLFAPYVVYRTGTGKTCVFGMEIPNMGMPNDRDDPHNFEVGKIRTLNLTINKFARDPQFNLAQPKYRNRVCPL